MAERNAGQAAGGEGQHRRRPQRSAPSTASSRSPRWPSSRGAARWPARWAPARPPRSRGSSARRWERPSSRRGLVKKLPLAGICRRPSLLKKPLEKCRRGDRTAHHWYPLAPLRIRRSSVRPSESWRQAAGPILLHMETMVTEETAPRPRVQWLNLVFLLGTFLVALVGTPWYLVKVGLGWPEALTFLVHLALRGPLGHRRLSPAVLPQDLSRRPGPCGCSSWSSAPARSRTRSSTGAADHRVHHAHVDEERDPYNIQKGFWWAHIGWIFFENEHPPPSVVRDLAEDPLVRWQDQLLRVDRHRRRRSAFRSPSGLADRPGARLPADRRRAAHRGEPSRHVLHQQPLPHGRPPALQPRAQRPGQPDHGRPGLRRGVPQLPPQLPLRLPQRRQGLALRPRQVDDLDALASAVSPAISAALPRPRSSRPRSRCSSSMPRSGCSRWCRLPRAPRGPAARGVRLSSDRAPRADHAPAPAEAEGGSRAEGEEVLPLETRLGLTYHALEQALSEWKKTLRQTNRLPVAA